METGLLDSWPKGGPRLLWKAQDLGEGYSGPAISGDRLYIQGQQGGQELVMAYDYCMGEDGAVGLIEATPAAYKEVSRFEIARGAFNTWTTPAIANGQLYLREQTNLYCYNVKR